MSALKLPVGTYTNIANETDKKVISNLSGDFSGMVIWPALRLYFEFLLQSTLSVVCTL